MTSIYLDAFSEPEREIILGLLEAHDLRAKMVDLDKLKEEVEDNTVPSLLTLVEDIDEWAGIFTRRQENIEGDYDPPGFDVTLRSWCNRLRRLMDELRVLT